MAVRMECRLKEVLAERGITQTKLSEMTGIRQPTISDIQRRNSINMEIITKIANALNITDIRELFRFVEVPGDK